MLRLAAAVGLARRAASKQAVAASLPHRLETHHLETCTGWVSVERANFFSPIGLPNR
jgi:hypothetical protein